MRNKLSLLCVTLLLCLPMTGCKSLEEAYEAAENVANEVGDRAENLEKLGDKAKDIDDQLGKAKKVLNITGKDSEGDSEGWEVICESLEEDTKDLCGEVEFILETMEAEGLEGTEGLQEIKDNCC